MTHFGHAVKTDQDGFGPAVIFLARQIGRQRRDQADRRRAARLLIWPGEVEELFPDGRRNHRIGNLKRRKHTQIDAEAGAVIECARSALARHELRSLDEGMVALSAKFREAIHQRVSVDHRDALFRAQNRAIEDACHGRSIALPHRADCTVQSGVDSEVHGVWALALGDAPAASAPGGSRGLGKRGRGFDLFDVGDLDIPAFDIGPRRHCQRAAGGQRRGAFVFGCHLDGSGLAHAPNDVDGKFRHVTLAIKLRIRRSILLLACHGKNSR